MAKSRVRRMVAAAAVIPLRADRGGTRVYDARVTDGASPASTFEIPAGYRKVPAPK